LGYFIYCTVRNKKTEQITFIHNKKTGQTAICPYNIIGLYLLYAILKKTGQTTVCPYNIIALYLLYAIKKTGLTTVCPYNIIGLYLLYAIKKKQVKQPFAPEYY
jgi:hypothetical protein